MPVGDAGLAVWLAALAVHWGRLSNVKGGVPPLPWLKLGPLIMPSLCVCEAHGEEWTLPNLALLLLISSLFRFHQKEIWGKDHWKGR